MPSLSLKDHVPKRSVDSGNNFWLMVNVMYFAHLFRWFSVRASLRILPQASAAARTALL